MIARYYILNLETCMEWFFIVFHRRRCIRAVFCGTHILCRTVADCCVCIIQ